MGETSTSCLRCGSDDVALSDDGICPRCVTASLIEAQTHGPYRLLRKLGEGAMGEVWEAHDPRLDRRVALKILKGHSPDDLAHFRREAQTSARLSHPNIAQVFEAGDDYIAMQLIDGVTLSQWGRQGAVRLVRDAARAIAYAHDHGIIHRDLKPDNLLVDAEGRVFVTDFGLAKQTKAESSLSLSGVVIGTPAYMSPEQARGQKADERSDVWGLGASLYALLRGNPPNRGSDVYEILRSAIEKDPPAPACDADLKTIVMKCLEKEPQRRYPTASALADDLTRFLQGEPIEASPAGAFYRLKKMTARRKAAVAAGGAGLALAFLTTFLFLLRGYLDAMAEARARSHIEAGRKMLEQIWVMRATPRYERAEIVALADRARAEFELAFTHVPGHAEAHLGIGRAHLHSWRSHEAIEHFNRAIAASPEFSTPYLERVRVELRHYEDMRRNWDLSLKPDTPATAKLKESILADIRSVRAASKDAFEVAYAEALLALTSRDDRRAVTLFHRHLARYPADSEALYWLGRALYELGEYAESIRVLRDTVALDHRNAPKHVALGHALWAEGNIEGAIAAYTRAYENDDQYTSALVGRAYLHTLKGDYDSAIADCTEALSKHPHFVAALLNRSLAHMRKGEYERCLEDCDRALAVDPSIPQLYVNRAAAYCELGRPDLAVQECDLALKQDPAFASAYVNRGLALQSLGRLDESIADLTRAVELDGGGPEAFNNRGISRRLKGDLDGAIADATRAIELRKDYVFVHVARGRARALQREFDGAIADFTSALAIDSAFDTALHERGMAWFEKGELDRALADLDGAAGLAPGKFGIFFDRGRVRRARGDRLSGEARKSEWEASIRDYDRSLELHPRHPEALVNRGNLKSDMGDAEGALQDYSAAQEINPRHPKALFNRGRLRFLRGELDGAIEDLTGALDSDPDYVAALYFRGQARQRKGELDRAVELSPRHGDAINLRGVTRYAQGDVDGAMKDYDRAIEINPNVAGYYFNRGLVYQFHRKDPDAARREYARAIELSSNYADAHFNRGLVRSELGDAPGAAEEFTRVIELRPRWGTPY